jgi:hypothetical protein
MILGRERSRSSFTVEASTNIAMFLEPSLRSCLRRIRLGAYFNMKFDDAAGFALAGRPGLSGALSTVAPVAGSVDVSRLERKNRGE